MLDPRNLPYLYGSKWRSYNLTYWSCICKGISIPYIIMFYLNQQLSKTTCGSPTHLYILNFFLISNYVCVLFMEFSSCYVGKNVTWLSCRYTVLLKYRLNYVYLHEHRLNRMSSTLKYFFPLLSRWNGGCLTIWIKLNR